MCFLNLGVKAVKRISAVSVVSGQSGAIRLAISRALLNLSESHLEPLQEGGYPVAPALLLLFCDTILRNSSSFIGYFLGSFG